MYGYLLLDNTKVVYIGLTQNIESRISSHKRSEIKFDSFTTVSFNDNEVAVKWEKENILKLKPIYNISIGGYCRKDAVKRKRFSTSLMCENIIELKTLAIKLNKRPCDIIDLALLDFFKNNKQ